MLKSIQAEFYWLIISLLLLKQGGFMDSIAQDSYQAALLMLVGMGFVYLFLTLLILSIHYIIRPIGEKNNLRQVTEEPAQQSGQTAKNSSGENQVSAPIVAAISAAVNRYRQDTPS